MLNLFVKSALRTKPEQKLQFKVTSRSKTFLKLYKKTCDVSDVKYIKGLTLEQKQLAILLTHKHSSLSQFLFIGTSHYVYVYNVQTCKSVFQV